MPGEVRVLGEVMASVMMEVNVGAGGAMMLGLLLFFCWRNSMKAAAMVHQKQHHVPYSLAISINGTFLLIHGIASMLWAFQYVFLIIYFRYFLFLVIFSCPSERVPYLRNFYFRKFGFPSIFIFLYFHLI